MSTSFLSFQRLSAFRCFPAMSSTNKLIPSRPTCHIRPSFKGFDSFAGGKGVPGRLKMVKASSFTSGSGGGGISGDEGTAASEQEALVGGNHSNIGLMTDRLESTLNRLSKWLSAALFCALILLKHDAESLWAASGSVINLTLSVMLKRILNQERPFSNKKSDPGMPSSHAQSIFFIVVYAGFSIFEWLGVSVLSVALSMMLLAIGAYFSWLRVSQQLHTISQVLMGAVLGSTFSGLWQWSWITFMAEAFSALLWVRILVILGAVGFSAGFILYVIRYWSE